MDSYFLFDAIWASDRPNVEAMAESNDFYDYQMYSNMASGSALGGTPTNTIDWLVTWYNNLQIQDCDF